MKNLGVVCSRPRELCVVAASDLRPLNLFLHHFMTLDEYQERAVRTVNPALDEQGVLIDAAAGLAEEAGESLAHVRKHVFQGRALNREALAEELGDALWCIATAARAIGYSLGAVAQENLAKITKRRDG